MDMLRVFEKAVENNASLPVKSATDKVEDTENVEVEYQYNILKY